MNNNYDLDVKKYTFWHIRPLCCSHVSWQQAAKFLKRCGVSHCNLPSV